MDVETKKEFEARREEMMENDYIFKGGTSHPEEIRKFNLEELHEKYRKLLYIENTDRIDVVLAVALSSLIVGKTPIWLILVGPSGDMKSLQLNALKGFNIFYLNKLTSKTLVNGYPDKDKYPDLAPKLDGKIIIIRDMAPLLKLNPTEKGEIWGQLRDLYDGFAGAASGMGMDVKYEGIKTTLLAGSTPSIDSQILIHQDLGTRELIYRTEGNVKKKAAMKKVMDDEEYEEKLIKELNEVTLGFLKTRKVQREFISDKTMDELMNLAEYTALMRATAEIDWWEKSLRGNVITEEPMRVVKQFKKLYLCLMSLADDYPEEKALKILWHVARSSSNPIRIELVDFFLENPEEEFTSNKLAEILKKGRGTMQVEAATLYNLGILTLKRQETTYPDKFYDFWKLNPLYDKSCLTPITPPEVRVGRVCSTSNIIEGEFLETSPSQISRGSTKTLEPTKTEEKPKIVLEKPKNLKTCQKCMSQNQEVFSFNNLLVCGGCYNILSKENSNFIE